MPCTIAQLLKKLKKAFPDRYTSISVDYDQFVHKEYIEIEYTLHVADKESEAFESLSELKEYVEYICKPLYAKDILNCGGETLIVD